LSHADISDCAVIGIPDEMAGERPCAYVVKKEGNYTLSEQDVCKFVEGINYYCVCVVKMKINITSLLELKIRSVILNMTQNIRLNIYKLLQNATHLFM
jgi:acyl-CoA synthetase (AMP-forming)/AMP-acid ligase II